MSYSLGNKDVMLIDMMSAGMMSPGFERTHKFVVVVSLNGVEIRQYEQLEMGHSKYAIHTERVAAPSIAFHDFCKVFKRQWEADPLDIRKAVKMAIKSSNSQNSVV